MPYTLGKLERPDARPPSWREFGRDLGRTEVVNGTVGALFAMSGPVAIILSVGVAGGLSRNLIASWVFGIFVLNGLLTILASWSFRQPLAFFWTIPGTVVVGQALDNLSWPEVLGAYVATAVLILALGLTGQVERVMSLLPMPVVMAMVAGTFLTFGLDLVRAVGDDAAVAVPMVAIFVAASAWPVVGRRCPPILGALVVGAIAVIAFGRVDGDQLGGDWLARPEIQVPVFTWSAITQLVVPLTITVVVVQNGQGRAVLLAAGHRPPMNLATVACGLWSLPAAAVGAISTCLTGPTNALLTASGERHRHYAAGVWCGLVGIVFGLFAPGAITLMSATPPAFVAVLGGLALLRALGSAFAEAFSGPAATGALVALLVTIANVQILNIGAAFWGIVIGVAVARLVDREAAPVR